MDDAAGPDPEPDADEERRRRRDRTRPAEILGMAGGLAAFAGLAVLLVTRDMLLAVEFAGGGFVIALVVLAMLVLATSKQEPPRGDG